MKNESVTKSGLAWLAIRSTGLLLIWAALTKASWFIFIIYRLTSEVGREISGTLSGRISWELALPQAVQFLLCVAAATYLLKGGRLIHRILVSIPKSVDRGKNAEQGAVE